MRGFSTALSTFFLRTLATNIMQATPTVADSINIVNQIFYIYSDQTDFKCNAQFTNIKQSVVQKFQENVAKLPNFLIETASETLNTTNSVICTYTENYDDGGEFKRSMRTDYDLDTSIVNIVASNDTRTQYNDTYTQVVQLCKTACNENEHLMHDDNLGVWLMFMGFIVGGMTASLSAVILKRTIPNGHYPVPTLVLSGTLWLSGMCTLFAMNVSNDLFNRFMYTFLTATAIPIVSTLPVIISLVKQKCSPESPMDVRETAPLIDVSAPPLRHSLYQKAHSMYATVKNCFSSQPIDVELNDKTLTNHL